MSWGGGLIALAQPVAIVATPLLLETLHPIASVASVPIEEATCVVKEETSLLENGSSNARCLPVAGAPTDPAYARLYLAEIRTSRHPCIIVSMDLVCIPG